MKTDSVQKEIEKILAEYEGDIKDAMMIASDKASRNLVKDLRSFNDFKRKRHIRNYSKGWRRRKLNNGYIVYNEKHPQLTHLLEYGHATSNQYGDFGTQRKGAVPHIASREQRHSEEFIKELKKELK